MKVEQKKFSLIHFFVFIVLFCTYILPTGIISTSFSASKLLFVLVICGLYMLTLKKFDIKEVIFLGIIIVMTVLSKNINYLMFITLAFLKKVLNYREDIVNYIKKSKILYVCLIFTLLYSLLFAGTGGRYAFAAIKEINQSGLSIFCLALLLMCKNKKVGWFTLLFGLLTISRSYYLAFIIYIFSKTKISEKISSMKITTKLNYFNLTVITSVILIGFGVFYIYEYKLGNIFWGDNISNRLYNFLDYSNFFRFVAVINILLVFKMAPTKLLFGVSDREFIQYGILVARELNIPYKYLVPHNLFFSHLKMYGIFSLFETIYVSSILKRVVDSKNFMIFIAIFMYSIFLGAGLYSYWLYLSVFVFLLYSNQSEERKTTGGSENENIND